LALVGVTKGILEEREQFESSEKYHLINSSLWIKFSFELGVSHGTVFENSSTSRHEIRGGRMIDIFSPVSLFTSYIIDHPMVLLWTPPPFPHPPHEDAHMPPQS
jgi:hypothetical protein